MSHFSTLVITKAEPTESLLAYLLAPYDENTVVEPYIEKTRKQLIDDNKKRIKEAMRDKAEWEGSGREGSFNEEYYEAQIKPMERALQDNDEEALYQDAIRYEEPEDINENGDLVSTYNPESKWDWWIEGGRFGIDLDGHSDRIQKKDFPSIDLNKPEEELIEEYPAQYQTWERLSSGEEQSFYSTDYLKKRYPTFRSYLEEHLLVTTWAVIDVDGNWHEPGTVGWFGCSDATPDDEAKWSHEYYDRFIKGLPDNYWLTIVDCHI